MKTFPTPAVVAASAALLAAPFSVAAAGTLFLTAGLGFIIHADYALRYRRIARPRRPAIDETPIRYATFSREDRCLAA